MKLLVLTAAAVAVTVVLTAPAGAASGITKHDRQVIAFFQHHPRAAATPAGGRILSRLLPRVVHALRTTQAAPPPIAHWALWNCITNGAYPGAPHEGNGYNGSYTGPLGMTTPWDGFRPTGSDWVHTPIAVVYADAEQGYARSGYSRSWLAGQWPHTSPPCFGFA